MTLKEELGYGLDALVLFRGLQQNPVIHALMEFCHADSSDLANQIRTYSSIVAALYPATDLEQPENRLGCRLPQTCCRHR